jgi:hypothetical protein
MEAKQIRRFLRLRFRTSSLLWLTVVVAAFFIGQQSDEVAGRLRQLWRTVWPGAAPYKLVSQPDGSILITCNSGVPRVIVNNPSVCGVEPIDARRIRVTKRGDGVATVDLWLDSARPPVPQLRLAFKVKNGKLMHTLK